MAENIAKGLEDGPTLSILNELELAKINLNFHKSRISESKSSIAINEDGISQTMKPI